MAGSNSYASFPHLSVRRAELPALLAVSAPMHYEPEDDEFVTVYFETIEQRDAVQTSFGGVTTLNTRPSTDVRPS